MGLIGFVPAPRGMGLRSLSRTVKYGLDGTFRKVGAKCSGLFVRLLGNQSGGLGRNRATGLGIMSQVCQFRAAECLTARLMRMRYHIDAIARGSFVLLALAMLAGAAPVRADVTSEAPHGEETVRLWALCPLTEDEPYPKEMRPPGLYALTGQAQGRIPFINGYEIRKWFPEIHRVDWIGNIPYSRYIVLMAIWDPSGDWVYTVLDKANPLDMQNALLGYSNYNEFACLEGTWVVISEMLEENWRETHETFIRAFDPETLTVSRPGKDAWQHVLRGQGLVFKDGRLVFRLFPDVPFDANIPERLRIDGKRFRIHWNDSRRTVLTTTMVGETSGIIMIIIDKGTRETITKEYEPRPGAFQVRWPWALWAATDHGRAPTAEEPFFMVRDWHVENLETGQSGEFILNVRSDNRGIDILNDVIFWGIGEELWAVDLREALEKGTTKPQLVWEDPLVPAIQALFYAQDGDGAQSNADEPGESRERRDG